MKSSPPQPFQHLAINLPNPQTKPNQNRAKKKRMLGSNMKSLKLLAIILAICVLLSVCHEELKMVEAEDCDVDLRGLVIECMVYMHIGDPTLINPNHRCCQVIQNANIPCCCHNLKKTVFPPYGRYSLEDMILWNKMLHCLNFCGKPLAPGTKCGSFTVPPGPPPK